MQLRIQFLILVLSFSTLLGDSPEQSFWQWFSKNDDRLFHFEKDQDKVFAELASEMHKVDKSLTFEFGPEKDGKRQFVISADGILESFPKVESLYAAAPKLDHWVFVKFRPRREPLDIEAGDLKIKAATVRVLLFKDDDPKKLAIAVLFPGYDAAKKKDYFNVAFLLLDGALGEYDVETKVGAIDVGPTNDPQAKNSFSLSELPKAFDLSIDSKKQ